MKTRRGLRAEREAAGAAGRKDCKGRDPIISIDGSDKVRPGKIFKPKKPPRVLAVRKSFARRLRVAANVSPTRPTDFYFRTARRAHKTAAIRAKTHANLAKIAEDVARFQREQAEKEIKEARELATFKARNIPASLLRIFKEQEKKAAELAEAAQAPPVGSEMTKTRSKNAYLGAMDVKPLQKAGSVDKLNTKVSSAVKSARPRRGAGVQLNSPSLKLLEDAEEPKKRQVRVKEVAIADDVKPAGRRVREIPVDDENPSLDPSQEPRTRRRAPALEPSKEASSGQKAKKGSGVKEKTEELKQTRTRRVAKASDEATENTKSRGRR